MIRWRLGGTLVAVLLSLPTTAAALFFDRTFSWQEEILISDGSTVSVQRDVVRQGLCSASLPGSCQVLKSSLRAAVPGMGKVRFEWKGSEWPVSFDIVAGRPWLVIPIAGLDACEKFGNPPESVVAFTWESGRWADRAYAEAPRSLKLNLTRRIPINDETRVTLEEKRRDREQGRELDQGFIPRHVKWEHSCARLNPPAAPEYEQALRHFTEMQWVVLNGAVVETKAEPVSMTLEEHRAQFGMPGDQDGIVGCGGKVSHKHSIFSTRRDGSGTGSKLTAYRIALAPGAGEGRAIFLPANLPTARGHIARVTCSETLIYVILRQERDAVGVLTYDVQGNPKNAWRIQVPDLAVADKNWGRVIDFADAGNRFRMVIGGYENHLGTRGAVVATLGTRYLIEAPK